MGGPPVLTLTRPVGLGRALLPAAGCAHALKTPVPGSNPVAAPLSVFYEEQEQISAFPAALLGTPQLCLEPGQRALRPETRDFQKSRQTLTGGHARILRRHHAFLRRALASSAESLTDCPTILKLSLIS